jgi:hypothetical protein
MGDLGSLGNVVVVVAYDAQTPSLVAVAVAIAVDVARSSETDERTDDVERRGAERRPCGVAGLRGCRLSRLSTTLLTASN